MVTSALEAVHRLRDAEKLGALLTVVAGENLASIAVVAHDDGVLVGKHQGWLDTDVLAGVEALMERERSAVLEVADRRIFVDIIAPRPVLVIFGASHVAQPLSGFARRAGFHVAVADRRATWATPERFPDVDALIVASPETAFERYPPDRRTYVALLTHDARVEMSVLSSVRGTPIRYLGMMGSRVTQAARVRHLREDGWSDSEIDFLRGPIGLDIGAQTPAEIAIAILAEMIMVRNGSGMAGSLSGTHDRIE